MASPEIVAFPSAATFERHHAVLYDLMVAATNSIDPDTYGPMLQRLNISTMKCACLLAAVRQEPREERITIEVTDYIKALSYVSDWIPSTLELIGNLGKSAFESDVVKTLKFVTNHDGCAKGDVMRHYRFSAREMTNVLDTLEGRGQLDIRREGKAQRLWLVGG
jgi:hypothetical protein